MDAAELGLYIVAAGLGVGVGSLLAPRSPLIARRYVRSVLVSARLLGDPIASAAGILGVAFHVLLAATVALHAPLIYARLSMTTGDASLAMLYATLHPVVGVLAAATAAAAAALLAYRLGAAITGRAGFNACQVAIEASVLGLYATRYALGLHVALAAASLALGVLASLHAALAGKLFSKGMLGGLERRGAWPAASTSRRPRTSTRVTTS